MKCKICNKPIEKERKFCSYICYWKSMKGSSGYWLGKKRPENVKKWGYNFSKGNSYGRLH